MPNPVRARPWTDHHAEARRHDRADAARPLPQDGRGHAPRGHGHDRRIRQCGAALPRPSRAHRRTRHTDLARARRTDQRARRRAATLARGSAEGRGHHVPQPPRLRRGGGGRQPDRLRRRAAQHLVRRTRAGRGGQPRGRGRRGVRRGIHRDGGPRAGRQAGRQPHRGLDRRRTRTHRREADHRARRATAPAQRPQGQDDPADLRHDRNTQGRQPNRRQRRNRHPQGDSGPHAVAGRGERS